jgi:hypothetical protein
MRTSTPAEVLWVLHRDDKTLRCELRDDMRRAGWDVQLFETERLMFAQRCPTERSARYLAASIRRERLRDGWVVKI